MSKIMISRRLVQLLFEPVKIIQKINDSIFTYWARPNKVGKYKLINHFEQKEKIGIIIQGPIEVENNFTLETVRLYKKIYENTKIIVSTWDNTDQNVLEKFQKEDVEIVLSKMPETFLRTNVMRQSKSAFAGILRAEELGCSYVCKTRTDQRMYANDLFTYLLSLLRNYPLDIKTNARNRIITCDSNMFTNYIYDMNDMWNFGRIEDMKCYWNMIDVKKIFNEEDFKQLERYNWPETILFSHYLRKIGHEIKWSLEDTRDCYAKYTIVIDSNTIDLYWKKCKRDHLKRTYDSNTYDDYTHRIWVVDYFNITKDKDS